MIEGFFHAKLFISGPASKSSVKKKADQSNQKYYGSIFSVLNQVEKEMKEGKVYLEVILGFGWVLIFPIAEENEDDDIYSQASMSSPGKSPSKSPQKGSFSAQKQNQFNKQLTLVLLGERKPKTKKQEAKKLLSMEEKKNEDKMIDLLLNNVQVTDFNSVYQKSLKIKEALKPQSLLNYK